MAESDVKKKSFSKSIQGLFKDYKSEFKKVIWPTPKQIINNTSIVLAFLVVVGAFVSLLDFGFVFALKYITK